MCLAVPARIVELDENDNAVVDAMGNRWRCKTTLLADVKLGELVLVHAGFAIRKVDEEAARESLKYLREATDFLQRNETGELSTD